MDAFHPPPGLVAFDVDGTLLRGRTVCQCIGDAIGRSDEMLAFERLRDRDEIAAARRTMLGWYVPHGQDRLRACLSGATLAPGARAGLARLKAHGIRTALVSITWQFAVEWLAGELGAEHAVGTGWLDGDAVGHFWPDDKATWLAALLDELHLTPAALVAVGDSAGDVPMLRLAGRGYFVGATLPEPLPGIRHWPDADIGLLVDDMLRAQR